MEKNETSHMLCYTSQGKYACYLVKVHFQSIQMLRRSQLEEQQGDCPCVARLLPMLTTSALFMQHCFVECTPEEIFTTLLFGVFFCMLTFSWEKHENRMNVHVCILSICVSSLGGILFFWVPFLWAYFLFLSFSGNSLISYVWLHQQHFKLCLAVCALNSVRQTLVRLKRLWWNWP